MQIMPCSSVAMQSRRSSPGGALPCSGRLRDAGAAAARCVALALALEGVDCGLWAQGCGLWTVNGVEPEGAPARSCPLLPAPCTCERWHWVRGDPPNWTFSQARQAG